MRDPSQPLQPTVLGLILGTEGYGVRRAWLELLCGFERQGIETSALVLQRGEIATMMANSGVPVTLPDGDAAPAVTGRRGKFRQLGRRAMGQVAMLSLVVREIRLRRASALIVQSPLEVGLAGLAARLTGIRSYWLMPNTVSDTYPLDLNRRLYRLLFRHMNVVPVANSHFTRQTLGAGRFEAHVAHLGVNPAQFRPDLPAGLDRAAFSISEGAAVLGVFARMVADKGQLRLAEGLAALGEEGRDIHLLLCGGPLDTPYFERLRGFLAANGLTDRVHLVGPISNVTDYYGLCDIVVNSRLDAEPFGLSVIEGMMMGKPVLAHRLGGPGETVIDGVTGWHIEGPDVGSFEKGLQRMMADRQRWAEIGAAARAHAVANFTSEKMVERVTAIICGGALRGSRHQ